MFEYSSWMGTGLAYRATSPTRSAADAKKATRTTVAGSTRGQGLPMNAPKVAGNPKRGGTWTSGITSTYKQHDAHTALATNIYHHIGDKGIEPHPITNKLINDQPVTVELVKALDDWLQKNKPAAGNQAAKPVPTPPAVGTTSP